MSARSTSNRESDPQRSAGRSRGRKDITNHGGGVAPPARVQGAEQSVRSRRTATWIAAATVAAAVVMAVLVVNRLDGQGSHDESSSNEATATIDSRAPDDCVVPQAAEPGSVEEPSEETKRQLDDPDTKVAVRGPSGDVVGLARIGSFDLQPGDLEPAALQRRMVSLVPVEDRCGTQVGWASFRTREFFTMTEVAQPGFDIEKALRARGVEPYEAPASGS